MKVSIRAVRVWLLGGLLFIGACVPAAIVEWRITLSEPQRAANVFDSLVKSIAELGYRRAGSGRIGTERAEFLVYAPLERINVDLLIDDTGRLMRLKLTEQGRTDLSTVGQQQVTRINDLVYRNFERWQIEVVRSSTAGDQ